MIESAIKAILRWVIAGVLLASGVMWLIGPGAA